MRRPSADELLAGIACTRINNNTSGKKSFRVLIIHNFLEGGSYTFPWGEKKNSSVSIQLEKNICLRLADFNINK